MVSLDARHPASCAVVTVRRATVAVFLSVVVSILGVALTVALGIGAWQAERIGMHAAMQRAELLAKLDVERANLTRHIARLRRFNDTDTTLLEALRAHRASLTRETHLLRDRASTSARRDAEERAALRQALRAQLEHSRNAEATRSHERLRWRAERRSIRARIRKRLEKLRGLTTRVKHVMNESGQFAVTLEQIDENEPVEAIVRPIVHSVESPLPDPGDLLPGNESVFATLGRINALWPHTARPRYFSLFWADTAWLLGPSDAPASSLSTATATADVKDQQQEERAAWARAGGAYVLMARAGLFLERARFARPPARVPRRRFTPTPTRMPTRAHHLPLSCNRSRGTRRVPYDRLACSAAGGGSAAGGVARAGRLRWSRGAAEPRGRLSHRGPQPRRPLRTNGGKRVAVSGAWCSCAD